MEKQAEFVSLTLQTYTVVALLPPMIWAKFTKMEALKSWAELTFQTSEVVASSLFNLLLINPLPLLSILFWD